MQTIPKRHIIIMEAAGLLAALLFLAVDRCIGAHTMRLPEQAALVTALMLAGAVMTVFSVRRDARRLRREMDALLEAAASEEARAKRLCVMASAQIRRCLDSDRQPDASGSECSRYEIVKNAGELAAMISSGASLGANTALPELQQKLQRAEKDALDNRRGYEQCLKSYRAARDSVQSERLRRLLDLEEYPPKAKPAGAQACFGIRDPAALRSKMQICTAWANI